MSVCVWGVERGCAQPICPVCSALHVGRGLPKDNVLEQHGLLDSMSVRAMMTCHMKLYAYDSILVTFPSGCAGSKLRDICRLSGSSHLSILHHTLEYSRGDKRHSKFLVMITHREDYIDQL